MPAQRTAWWRRLALTASVAGAAVVAGCGGGSPAGAAGNGHAGSPTTSAGTAPAARPGVAAPAPTNTAAGAGAAAALQAALVAGAKKVGAPAATAAVVQCGSVVWNGVTGVTDVKTKAAVTPATRFLLASTTKTVTATMVMQLVQAGKLSLSAPLSKFYPQLPDASGITLKMLLNMTSGLPEYWDNARIQDIIDNDPTHVWTRSEIVGALATMKPQFPPGAKYLYTDSNYVVLGGIVEALTGTTVESWFASHVAAPAGMTASTFTYMPANSGQFAHPYDQSARGALSDQFTPGVGLSSDYWGPVWTDGGLASTALDLARFGNALFAGRLVSAATLRTMTVMGPADYGLGIYAESYDHHSWDGHNGAYGGYEAEDFTDPSRALTITVTTNVMEPDSASYAASELIWDGVVKAYDANFTPPVCPPGK